MSLINHMSIVQGQDDFVLCGAVVGVGFGEHVGPLHQGRGATCSPSWSRWGGAGAGRKQDGDSWILHFWKSEENDNIEWLSRHPTCDLLGTRGDAYQGGWRPSEEGRSRNHQLWHQVNNNTTIRQQMIFILTVLWKKILPGRLWSRCWKPWGHKTRRRHRQHKLRIGWASKNLFGERDVA